jgi:hypothetical protein
MISLLHCVMAECHNNNWGLINEIYRIMIMIHDMIHFASPPRRRRINSDTSFLILPVCIGSRANCLEFGESEERIDTQ